MDKEGIQQIVLFANQAMIETRIKVQSQAMIAYWVKLRKHQQRGKSSDNSVLGQGRES